MDNSDKTISAITKLNELKNKKYEYLSKITEIDNETRILYDYIRKNCKHNWERDYQTVSFDYTPYICTKCGLS